MANINEYFQAEDDGWFDHPRLRHWRKLLGEGARLKVEVARRTRGLDVGRAILCVTIVVNGQERIEEEEWSDDLNSGLIKLQVRASSLENEALRFGLAFSGAFEPAEDHVGDGFFNSVLIDALKQGPLAGRLADVLTQVHVLQPNRESKSYPDCRDLIVGGNQRTCTRAHAQPRLLGGRGEHDSGVRPRSLPRRTVLDQRSAAARVWLALLGRVGW